MDDLTEIQKIRAQTGIPADATVKDLIDEYGFEAVKRGLSYTQSLVQAEEEFKRSATSEKMEEGYDEAGLPSDHEKTQEASDAWEESMQEEGLGLDDE